MIRILENPFATADRFYEIWTQKESYLKYTGEGLGRNMQSFSTLAPEPGLRYWFRKLDDVHSLCLCAAENTVMLEWLDIQQL